MIRPYFKNVNGPSSLRATLARSVRFEECDQLGIMWHGRYPSYFEDAREALGDKYGIGYDSFKNANVVLPIVSMHIDYRIPLEYRQEYTVHAILHWSDRVKLNIEYEIYTPDNKLATRGYTMQVMVDFNKNVLLEPPHFYADFVSQWEAGKVS